MVPHVRYLTSDFVARTDSSAFCQSRRYIDCFCISSRLSTTQYGLTCDDSCTSSRMDSVAKTRLAVPRVIGATNGSKNVRDRSKCWGNQCRSLGRQGRQLGHHSDDRLQAYRKLLSSSSLDVWSLKLSHSLLFVSPLTLLSFPHSFNRSSITRESWS